MKSVWLMLALALSWQTSVSASELDKVLQQVKQGSLVEKRQAEQRVSQVVGEFDQAKAALTAARKNLAESNAVNIELEDRILQLQASLKQRREQYQAQRDSMNSVFTHVVEHGDMMLQRVTPYGLWQFDQSDFVSVDEDAVDIAQIKRLWMALLEQTILSGKALSSEQSIVLANGQPRDAKVTQFGPFNAYAELEQPSWLHYLPGEQAWMVMDPQPSILVTEQQATIDPSFGALLDKQAHAPSWLERMAPAGVVGVLIVLIGVLGAGIALVRCLALRKAKRQMYAQMSAEKISDDNALGRVMLASEKCQNAQLEAVIDEAVLKEVPSFKTGVGSLAVFASIPPLLGLLGTVGGMIETFRIITEHGSADSQLLSGGISQALLTTEMGLIVAVPLLLLHCGLKAQSTQLIELLEQQSVGLVVLRQQANAKRS
ncbi:MotA/TolQ/ExbB proton channel family protein [Vibrio vulnificus]|uniref:MotA/TolQ/ExbB proton channel family protein n=1 Tax=Vibrio harveyi TaxID=669 RepID=UPI000DF1A182|nr:MotA/TolQ/ExbB proton channel family protein [Vibrio harveyi]EIV1776532.1 MotA/TolQ/ExbB proton channel family protein [Vibrio vulnificus]EIZ0990924.1 MotA/TolQ/ExbB proton channel family protein [Vibrio vulnificus]ELX4147723.1 MotA/TolQ/ExbB proton channel family protein [Vibrio vulnificus]RCR63607.1 MotA/TolQ/ExbB proton channel family protein [Vibrio harveyi]